MLSCYSNYLCQFTLDVQLEGMLVRSLSHSGYTGNIFEPFHRGRTSKADLHTVLADIFERGNVIDLDQPPFADDGDAVAGLLYLRQNVGGEEDGASLSVDLGDHFIEFLLVEWVESAGWFVQDEQARFVHEDLHQPQ